MNILFIADPNSIHDVKWVSELGSTGVSAIWLPRKHHQKGKNSVADIIGYIPDFSVIRFWRTIWTAYKIKRFVISYQVDIIHIMYAEPNALWCNFRNFFSVPMVITSRGTDVLKTIPQAFEKRDPLNQIVAWLYKRAFQKADFVTGTSVRQLESISKFSSRESDTAIVRTGVDIDHLKTDTSKYFPLKNETPYLLFPRYIKPLYNHELCLKAISLLPSGITDQYQMVFIGKNSGDHDYQSRLENIMEGIPNVKFEFLPKQPQEAVFELYKRASAVVMTPHSDGSPVSAMEAMLCGKPVILGPLAYDSELFEGKVWQMTNWDANELAQLIQITLKNQLPSLTAEDSQHMDLKCNMGKMRSIYGSIML